MIANGTEDMAWAECVNEIKDNTHVFDQLFNALIEARISGGVLPIIKFETGLAVPVE